MRRRRRESWRTSPRKCFARSAASRSKAIVGAGGAASRGSAGFTRVSAGSGGTALAPGGATNGERPARLRAPRGLSPGHLFPVKGRSKTFRKFSGASRGAKKVLRDPARFASPFGVRAGGLLSCEQGLPGALAEWHKSRHFLFPGCPCERIRAQKGRGARRRLPLSANSGKLAGSPAMDGRQVSRVRESARGGGSRNSACMHSASHSRPDRYADGVAGRDR